MKMKIEKKSSLLILKNVTKHTEEVIKGGLKKLEVLKHNKKKKKKRN